MASASRDSGRNKICWLSCMLAIVQFQSWEGRVFDHDLGGVARGDVALPMLQLQVSSQVVGLINMLGYNPWHISDSHIKLVSITVKI